MFFITKKSLEAIRKKNFSKIIILKNPQKIVINSIISVIIFALLYYLSDLFMVNNPDIVKKYNLGYITKVDNFWNYLHFSLITQTTVGYDGGGLEGGRLYSQIRSIPFKFFNTLQLFSIFFILYFHT